MIEWLLFGILMLLAYIAGAISDLKEKNHEEDTDSLWLEEEKIVKVPFKLRIKNGWKAFHQSFLDMK